MNALTPIIGRHLDGVGRGGGKAALLERLCDVLGPTDAQCADVKAKYDAVSKYLAASIEAMFRNGHIYAHGSFATGTALRPIDQAEFDVDLIWHVPDPSLSLQPVTLKKAVGDRLRAHGTYARMLEEKSRCWRLNYAGSFHLDITPSIPNEACRNGGCLVPDKTLRQWKETHPVGFRLLFERRASLAPVFRLSKAIARDSMHARIDPFPEQDRMRGHLRRIVQLSKRSRDIYFSAEDLRLWPISVIITTLASRSYEWCVTNMRFDDDLDLVCEVVGRMPDFIDLRPGDKTTTWAIWNETTQGENFAEKWNVEQDRVEAFFAWHNRFSSDLRALRSAVGLDIVRASLGHSFGLEPVGKVFDEVTASTNVARAKGTLALAPGLGLVHGASPRTAVRSNTFFGRD